MLGSGAFGKVIKAEAIGINNFSPRDKSQKKSQRRPKIFRQHRAGHAYHDPRGSAYTKTTVAVKTVKGNVSNQEISLSSCVTFTMEQGWLVLVGGRWKEERNLRYTVKPLLSGHLRELPKCPLNRCFTVVAAGNRRG